MSYPMVINDIEAIRNTFIEMLEEENFVTDKTGVKCLEIVGAQFFADEPSIFGEPNIEYVTKEIQWYVSQSLNVNDIAPPVPKIWKQVSDVEGYINSNYGWCIFSEENGFQYDSCLNQLRMDSDTRRAIMIYTRPEMQQEYNRNGMSDFICTNTVQYFIRDNFLHSYVSMRSNDAVFGYKNDWAWQKWVLKKACRDLKEVYPDIEEGQIIWNAGSLHVYERHFNLVKF